jgi:catechol 2,3-dioxygenase-like lactoylglutathione lyase family enzyme
MKIMELELHTRQLAALKKFYTATLQLSVLSESEDKVCFAAGTSRLYFTHNPERGPGSYHFAFRVPDTLFDTVTERLQGKVNFIADPESGSSIIRHVEWQARAVYFLDPEENIVEIIAHKTIPAETDKSINPTAAIVSVCEIGLVVPYVPAFAAELKEKLQLNRWKTANEKFEAVGDAEGLFILAEEHRAWFPTKLCAARLPARVKVDTPGKAAIDAGVYTITQHEPS